MILESPGICSVEAANVVAPKSPAFLNELGRSLISSEGPELMPTEKSCLRLCKLYESSVGGGCH